MGVEGILSRFFYQCKGCEGGVEQIFSMSILGVVLVLSRYFL